MADSRSKICSSQVRSRSYHLVCTDAGQSKTDDANIFLYPSQYLEWTARGVVAILVPFWMVLPAILLYNTSQPRARAFIYAVFTVGTSLAMVSLIKTTKYNLVLGVVT
jgi:hypothetical protein